MSEQFIPDETLTTEDAEYVRADAAPVLASDPSDYPESLEWHPYRAAEGELQ